MVIILLSLSLLSVLLLLLLLLLLSIIIITLLLEIGIGAIVIITAITIIMASICDGQETLEMKTQYQNLRLFCNSVESSYKIYKAHVGIIVLDFECITLTFA